jgi:hypothetical protein
MSSMAGAANAQSEPPLPLAQLTRFLWANALALLVMAAALLMARRMAGAFAEPLPGGWLVVAALLLVGVVWLLRRINPVLGTEYLVLSTPKSRTAGAAIPGLAAALVLVAITLPGTPGLAVAVAWFLFIVAEAATWLPQLLRRNPMRIADRQRGVAMPQEGSEEQLESIPDAVVQQITRERTPEGDEAIHAVLRVPMEAGDNLAVAHLAFCPPLPGEPTLAAHVLDDSGAEPRITLAQSFGARIEVRMSRAGQSAASALIEVIGTARAEASGESSGG